MLDGRAAQMPARSPSSPRGWPWPPRQLAAATTNLPQPPHRSSVPGRATETVFAYGLRRLDRLAKRSPIRKTAAFARLGRGVLLASPR